MLVLVLGRAGNSKLTLSRSAPLLHTVVDLTGVFELEVAYMKYVSLFLDYLLAVRFLLRHFNT